MLLWFHTSHYPNGRAAGQSRLSRIWSSARSLVPTGGPRPSRTRRCDRAPLWVGASVRCRAHGSPGTCDLVRRRRGYPGQRACRRPVPPRNRWAATSEEPHPTGCRRLKVEGWASVDPDTVGTAGTDVPMVPHPPLRIIDPVSMPARFARSSGFPLYCQNHVVTAVRVSHLTRWP